MSVKCTQRPGLQVAEMPGWFCQRVQSLLYLLISCAVSCVTRWWREARQLSGVKRSPNRVPVQRCQVVERRSCRRSRAASAHRAQRLCNRADACGGRLRGTLSHGAHRRPHRHRSLGRPHPVLPRERQADQAGVQAANPEGIGEPGARSTAAGHGPGPHQPRTRVTPPRPRHLTLGLAGEDELEHPIYHSPFRGWDCRCLLCTCLCHYHCCYRCHCRITHAKSIPPVGESRPAGVLALALPAVGIWPLFRVSPPHPQLWVQPQRATCRGG